MGSENIKSWFSHDSSARNSPELINVRMKYGAEGYGIYFMILERLRDEKDYRGLKDYNAIAFDLHVDASKVKSIVEDFNLFSFSEDGKHFFSEGFLKRMQIKDESAKKKSLAGKRGAEVRWNKQNDSKDIADECKRHSNAITKLSSNNKTKKNEIPENAINSIKEAWNKIDNVSKIMTLKTGTLRNRLVKARINEYGLDKVLQCIEEVNKSSFLKGFKSDNGWKADFDWVMKPNNFIKVLEGKYKDEGGNKNEYAGNRKKNINSNEKQEASIKVVDFSK